MPGRLLYVAVSQAFAVFMETGHRRWILAGGFTPFPSQHGIEIADLRANCYTDNKDILLFFH